MLFALPKKFDEEGLIAINQFHELAHENELILDFRPVEYVYPFPTLVMVMALHNLMKNRRKNGLKTKARGLEKEAGAISYLKYFGFFKSLGFSSGNSPNDAPGGKRYLPITFIRRKDLGEDNEVNSLQEGIDKYCDRLARVIFQGRENIGAATMLSYCFREIIRNSFEHGGVKSCIVMAQRWYNWEAEITIADSGVGIYESLKTKHNVNSRENALKLSLFPGITSAAESALGTKWDNTGFGLYVISELGRQYGEFSILSSNRLLTNKDGRRKLKTMDLGGTIVKLKINTNDGDYFPNILSNIVDEGEKLADKLTGAVKTASKMSKTHSKSLF